MDVLIFLIFSIAMIYLIDKNIKSSVIKISFVVLNAFFFILVMLSSNSPVVSKIVLYVIEKSHYETLHQALINNAKISIISYSSYTAVFVFAYVELMVAFFNKYVSLINEITNRYILDLNKKRIIKFTKISNFVSDINKNSHIDLSNLFIKFNNLRC